VVAREKLLTTETQRRRGIRQKIKRVQKEARTTFNSYLNLSETNWNLFPLNCARRFGRDVVDHAVDPTYFVDDAIGDALDNFPGKFGDVGSHTVFRMYGADRAGVGIGALISHDTDGHYGQKYRERLPDFFVKTGALDFVDDDVVRVLEQGNSFGSDLAENAHGQTWAGERLALQHVVRHSQITPDSPHLILKQIL